MEVKEEKWNTDRDRLWSGGSGEASFGHTEREELNTDKTINLKL